MVATKLALSILNWMNNCDITLWVWQLATFQWEVVSNWNLYYISVTNLVMCDTYQYSEVYSSVFTYNPNVLTRRYQHLTSKASIEPHHLTCISLDISVLIVRFGDRARACRVDTPTSHRKRARRPSIKVSWPFDELSDNNGSDDELSLSASVAVNKQILEVILMLGNNAVLMAYQINVRYNTYARDGAFRLIN